MSEEWKDIEGWEGLYQVSDLGRVRSLTRTSPTSRGEGVRIIKGRVLKPYQMPSGYLQIQMNKSGVHRQDYVHRLVLEAFVGPCPEGMECRHFPDQNRSSNQLSNLSWATPTLNQSDKIINGTTNRGTRQWLSKFTEDQIVLIRNKYSQGATQSELASEFNVNQATISGIVTHSTWAHVEEGAKTKNRETNYRGVSMWKSKLNDEAVVQIRKRTTEGARSIDLAKEFGVSQSNIRSVVTRKTWKHVD